MELLDILRCFASISGSTGAMIDGEEAPLSQNAVLFGINLFGVYRYLSGRKAVDG